ncbi:hypothetical protein QFZ66_008115 [Streptomyces sp. B4I13]|nr:hypothetical protein [Streptomyces sp. B4I13]
MKPFDFPPPRHLADRAPRPGRIRALGVPPTAS